VPRCHGSYRHRNCLVFDIRSGEPQRLWQSWGTRWMLASCLRKLRGCWVCACRPERWTSAFSEWAVSTIWGRAREHLEMRVVARELRDRACFQVRRWFKTVSPLVPWCRGSYLRRQCLVFYTRSGEPQRLLLSRGIWATSRNFSVEGEGSNFLTPIS
jgi:hypothetical protein